MSQSDKSAAARKRTLSAMLTSLAIHAILLVAAASLTIMIIAPKPKMMFEGKKSPSVPPRKLEHAIRVQQMKKQTRKPQILQRLVTEAPSQVVLPEMPQMKTPDVKDLRDTPLMNSRAGSIGGIGGGGGGAGRGLGGGTGYSDTKFFGENLRTRAICICMDISPSMVNKGVVQDVANEASAMLDRMNANTKFNIVVFVDGATPFQPQMVYATRENRDAALAWLKKGFDSRRDGNNKSTSGSTPSMAIHEAIQMGAETIFVLTDDPPYLSNSFGGEPIASHQDDIMAEVKAAERTTGHPVKLYPTLYKPHQTLRGRESWEYYKKLAHASSGGKCIVWPKGWERDIPMPKTPRAPTQPGTKSSKSSSGSTPTITRSNARNHGRQGIPDE
ncbi:MAG: hypothetical protein IK066_10840 [Kiritimatiellae bacterium]|nr:hypothetical protein [Kiritimatiellia bacterium]